MEFMTLIEKLGIEFKPVMDRFSNNEKLLSRFLCKFPQEKTYQQFRTAYLNNDLDASTSYVHTLKGISANLGLESLNEKCVTMLADLRGERKNLEEEFVEIENEYTRVTNIITSFCES